MMTRTYGPMLSDETNDDECGDVGIPHRDWKDLITASMQENDFGVLDEALEPDFDPPIFDLCRDEFLAGRLS